MRVLDRVQTARGELVLRSDGRHCEVVSNGVFLMDTRDGASERELVSAAVTRCARPATVLVGGLGVGFSLLQALAEPALEQVVVVEREAAVVGWHRSWLAPYSQGALDDPRVSVVVDDLAHWLGETAQKRPGSVDVACLDTDNGPDWLVSEDNAALYAADGLAVLARVLRPGGVAAFWSASAAPTFADRLASAIGPVETLDVPSANAPRGEPDVVYLARLMGAD
jgi:spermidine synthase